MTHQSCVAFIFILFFHTVVLHAHPGGLNKNGCHNDRKNGGYHCHDGSGLEDSRGNTDYSNPKQNSGGNGGFEVITQVSSISKKKQSIKIVGVTDGDTVRALIEGQEVKIRLYGIDAPESGQPFGKSSQQALKNIITGRQINIKVIDRDRYGRLVALISADGANVNEIMISSGFAWTYTQYCKQSFCNDWEHNQTEAQKLKKGLWQSDVPIPPWEWRNGK